MFHYCFVIRTCSTSVFYTLSLHDALPISRRTAQGKTPAVISPLALEAVRRIDALFDIERSMSNKARSEEHTSELQSHSDLVCRLLLEKKKKIHRLMKCLSFLTLSRELTTD